MEPDDLTRRARRNALPCAVMKLDPEEDADELELEFEVRFLASLTIAQRFELMLRKSGEMKELLESSGHRSAPAIVKRA